jgi:N-acetylmuramoyl-L-alanine amidase
MTQWHPSPSYDARRPNFIVIHHTAADDAGHSLETLTDPSREVSAHYLVGREGTIWQLVDERARAWHAGQSYWAGVTDLNSVSIGIELDNNGNEPFAEPQIAALLALLQDLTTRYHIPAANVVGHGDIAPGRKVDPSRLFPWRELAQHGYGLWCEAADVQAASSQGSAVEDHDAMNERALLLLQALGYDVRDPDAAIAAFRRHYDRDDASELAQEDVALLQCLVRLKAQDPS